MLLSVCRQLCEEQMESAASSSETSSKQQKKVEEVLNKLVRIIANASIAEEIGETIAGCDAVIDLLMRILG